MPDKSHSQATQDTDRPEEPAVEQPESAETEKNAPDTEAGAAEPEIAEDAPAGEAEPPREKDPVAEAEKKAKEFEDAYFRSRAELENFRRRMAREKQEFMKVAAANIIEDLLPVFDNLELGLQAARQHPDARDITSGFEMVVNQFTNILGEHGLKKLEPVGEPFDPNLHEATGHEASEDYDEGVVSACLRAGYQLNERLLRPATVVVSKGPAGNDASSDKETGAGGAK
ncbi:MAG: nucleotide exchange factor GrpE [Opitutales bacterium]